MRRLALALTALCLAAAPPLALAEKQRIERADQLPVHTYAIAGGKVSTLVQDDAALARLASDVRRDLEADLAAFDLQDAATLREYHNTLARIAVLDGRLDDALVHADRVQALEEKPAVRTISNFVLRSIIDAKRAPAPERGAAFDAAVRRRLASFPFEQVQAELRTAKAGLERQSKNLYLGLTEEQLDPAAKAGPVSKEVAIGAINVGYVLREALPYRDAAVKALGELIGAHKVEKPDIWAAREVSLEGEKKLTPVVVAIWDTGVDVSLFPGQLWVNPKETPGNGKDDDRNGWVDDVNGIGFTWTGERVTKPLLDVPFGPEELEQAKRNTQGWTEMQAGLDTPQTQEVRRQLASIPKEQVRPFIESLSFFGMLGHGTHVAGIAAAGNPAVRLMHARIEFPWQLVPPAPDEAWARGFATAMRESIAYFKKAGVRVVNMSWGLTVKEIEEYLERSGRGGNPEEHRRNAQRWFEAIEKEFRAAIAGAPEILFVAGAGNANSDARFERFIPSSFDLPNTITAGAVDRAGDEAAFTSFGKVEAYANGYEVDSFVPGGDRQRWSGTSMAAPQVANLAAKIVARHPRLKATEVKRAIVEGADPKRIGDRTIPLMNPKRSMELAAGLAGRGAS